MNEERITHLQLPGSGELACGKHDPEHPLPGATWLSQWSSWSYSVWGSYSPRVTCPECIKSAEYQKQKRQYYSIRERIVRLANRLLALFRRKNPSVIRSFRYDYKGRRHCS